MGGIRHQQAVAAAEDGVEDPVLVGHRVPGGLHGGRQGGSAEAAENGGGYKYGERGRPHRAAPGS